MSVTGLWFDAAVPTLLLAVVVRAIWAAVMVEASARWLLAASRRPIPHVPRPQAPWLVVLLPMLREQAVAPETIAAFTTLDYPDDHAVVVVITTEREATARQERLATLRALGSRRALTVADLRGLFPADRCADVAHAVNAVPASRRGDLLAVCVQAEPTTAQVITAAAARRAPGSLLLVHLHQPAEGGRKAGQLNFAVRQLDSILSPHGWSRAEDADRTYVAVYDADALPDVRTLRAFADADLEHRSRTGSGPAVVQQQRLPLLGRRPFPAGATGLMLAGEWVYQLRRSLGIELARVRLNHWLMSAPLPASVRTALRPMIYGVGCGLAVRLPALETIGLFPEPMEDLGTGHRLSLLGAAFVPSVVTVLDEPYTDPMGLTNLHALAFIASGRPDLHARAVAEVPSALSRHSQRILVLREWADEAAWLIGAPLATAAVASAGVAGPIWAVIAVVGVLLHGPVLTARILHLAPALHSCVVPPASVGRPAPPAPAHRAALIAASPLQPFMRLVGPWWMIIRRLAGRAAEFGKTER